MSYERLNIINLKSRPERKVHALQQMQQQGIDRWLFWEGIVHPVQPYIGIATSHKRIVADAKERGLKEVLIGEDDLQFFAPGAFDYFLHNKPESYDLYFGNIFQGYAEPDGTIISNSFAGMTLYFVHERFYESFLSVGEGNIDRMLMHKEGKYVVCDPMVTTQCPGYSDNKKETVASYAHYIHDMESKGLKVFGRERFHDSH